MRNLLWQPLAMMLVVMLCFAVVSAPAVTIAQDAPVTEETTTEAVVATEETASIEPAPTKVTEEVVPEKAAELNEVTAEFMVNNLWIMIAGMLVFIMHLGFATLESGLTRSKNTVNILFKNTMIVCIGLITYGCLLYTSPSPRDATLSRMPSSA